MPTVPAHMPAQRWTQNNMQMGSKQKSAAAGLAAAWAAGTHRVHERQHGCPAAHPMQSLWTATLHATLALRKLGLTNEGKHLSLIQKAAKLLTKIILTDEGKHRALVHKVDDAGAHGEAGHEHVAGCKAGWVRKEIPRVGCEQRKLPQVAEEKVMRSRSRA